MQKFTCENKTKLSDFLLDKYQGGLSYGKFCTLLRKKDIKINQKRVNKDCVLQKGDNGDGSATIIVITEECLEKDMNLMIQKLQNDNNIKIANKIRVL